MRLATSLPLSTIYEQNEASVQDTSSYCISGLVYLENQNCVRALRPSVRSARSPVFIARRAPSSVSRDEPLVCRKTPNCDWCFRYDASNYRRPFCLLACICARHIRWRSRRYVIQCHHIHCTLTKLFVAVTKRASNATLCTTPACVHAASNILYGLSPNYKKIDPCTNIDEMVCGGWRDRHELRADQGDMFTGTLMAESSNSLLKRILEGAYPQPAIVSGL